MSTAIINNKDCCFSIVIFCSATYNGTMMSIKKSSRMWDESQAENVKLASQLASLLC